MAKPVYAPSIRLITESFLAVPGLSAAITERYERVMKENCATRSVFIEKLVLAGLESFDKYEESRKPKPRVEQPTPEQGIDLG